MLAAAAKPEALEAAAGEYRILNGVKCREEGDAEVVRKLKSGEIVGVTEAVKDSKGVVRLKCGDGWIAQGVQSNIYAIRLDADGEPSFVG